MSQLRGIPGEFLTERERRRVLQMGAADLHNRLEIPSFGGKRGVQPVERRQQLPHHRFRRRNIHRGRKHVVRRLPAIDVVVRMHELPLPARSAENLRRAIGKHLVDVHVGLGSGSCLPYGERKLAVVAAVERLVCGGDDRIGDPGLEDVQACVDPRRATLDQQHRADQLRRHLLAGDAEMLERALRLRAPQALGGDLDRSEGIALNARVGRGHVCSIHLSQKQQGGRTAPFPDLSKTITRPGSPALPRVQWAAPMAAARRHPPPPPSSTGAGGPCRRLRAP